MLNDGHLTRRRLLETGRFDSGDTDLSSSDGQIVGTQLLTPCRCRFILAGTDTTWRNASSSSTDERSDW
jgi:hypothetical protein